VGKALTLLLLLAACGEDVRRKTAPAPPQAAVRTAADPAAGITTELDGVTASFGDAVLAEMIGDEPSARAGFEAVLAAPTTPAFLAARAALHLAQMDSQRGRRRSALDLAARAAALAPTDVVIGEGVAVLEADDVGSTDVRGPRLGTPLPGVPAHVAEAWAAAERAFGAVHQLRPRARIEAVSKSIDIKVGATEEAAGKYRAIVEHGGIAAIAAHYRLASLYHHLALTLLLFEAPAELATKLAQEFRRTLRVRGLAYLKKAVAEYRACIAAPQQAELWRLAAETDLRRAVDVLGAGGVKVSDG